MTDEKKGSPDSPSPRDLRAELSGETSLEDREVLKRAETATVPAEVLREGGEPSGDIRTLLQQMSLPEKVKAAMFGNSTCRGILITDSQRMIQEAVLKNPQLQEREVLEYARNPNVTDSVLRRISDSKQWSANYLLKYHLVLNPKTPQDIAMKWVRYLRQSDLKKVARSKNIGQVIANAAKKRLNEMQKKS